MRCGRRVARSAGPGEASAATPTPGVRSVLLGPAPEVCCHWWAGSDHTGIYHSSGGRSAPAATSAHGPRSGHRPTHREESGSRRRLVDPPPPPPVSPLQHSLPRMETTLCRRRLVGAAPAVARRTGWRRTAPGGPSWQRDPVPIPSSARSSL